MKFKGSKNQKMNDKGNILKNKMNQSMVSNSTVNFNGRGREQIVNNNTDLNTTLGGERRSTIKKESLDLAVLQKPTSKEKFRNVSKIRKHDFRKGFDSIEQTELSLLQQQQHKEMNKSFKLISEKYKNQIKQFKLSFKELVKEKR